MGAGLLLQGAVSNPEPLTELQSQTCLGSTPTLSSSEAWGGPSTLSLVFLIWGL